MSKLHRHNTRDAPGPYPVPLHALPLPPASSLANDQALMASLGISFHEGVYHLAGCRYVHLRDAVNHARTRAPAPGGIAFPGAGH